MESQLLDFFRKEFVNIVAGKEKDYGGKFVTMIPRGKLLQ